MKGAHCFADDGQDVEGLPTEGVEITCFHLVMNSNILGNQVQSSTFVILIVYMSPTLFNLHVDSCSFFIMYSSV